MESNIAPISTNTWTWRQKINILNKPYWVQYCILGCWIIAFCFTVIYITYQTTIPELIENSILPANLIWMLYVSAGLFITGNVLLVVTPIAPEFYNKILYPTIKEQIVHQVADLYAEKRYTEINKTIEQFLTMREQYHLIDDVRSLLEWMQKAQVNRSVLDQITTCLEYTQKRQINEAEYEFQQLQNYINTFIPFVNPDIFPKMDLLYNQIQALRQI